MAVVPRGRGSSRPPPGSAPPPSRSNPSPFYWGACPSRMPLPRPPPHGGGLFVLRIKVGVSW
eukprot:6496150-Prymnesium_polylepis.1